MTRPAERILLDTNVWLDAFLPGRAARVIAQELITLALKCHVDLLYPVHIISDVFYLAFIDIKRLLRGQGSDELVAQAARSTAWEYVNSMREIATAVGADNSDVWLASKWEALHSDIEDNLVLAAAKRAQADYVVTSDKQLLSHAALAGVAALSPVDMLDVLQKLG
ncbi:MAG: PIN domain-containing protein [Atopobiaceae bacterium]|nr:PIN domain-containing protein [Atopobiaceae bacterium]